LAREKPDAAQGKPRTENPLASRTPEALRLSRSAEELAAIYETEEIGLAGWLANPHRPV
jgi:hypothetical protein